MTNLTQQHIEEAKTLVDISEQLYNKKLTLLNANLATATKENEKIALEKKIDRLHDEYIRSIEEIETFIRATC